MLEPTVVALTPCGVDLGHRIVGGLGRGQVVLASDAVRETLENLFREGKPLVCIMALAIVVRILGPLTADKKKDPPVVVVDETGRFAISVLGGHIRGANELAEKVAAALGATPVITTASEALGLPALDLVGRAWGWKIENPEAVKGVAAAMVRGEQIAVLQDCGSPHWWQEFGAWPRHFQRIETWPQGPWGGALFITDLWSPAFPFPTVLYRPPSLVLGIGCRRGVPCAEIEALFQYLCQSRGYASLSLAMVATASLKADEPGILQFAALHDVPLRAFTIGELAQVEDLPTPSAKVLAKIGVRGVAEPAAMLAAKASSLLVPKYRAKSITMALARRDHA